MKPLVKQILRLGDDVVEFELGRCGPSDDPDKQTAYLYAFKEVAKRFVGAAGRLDDPDVKAALGALNLNPQQITDAYDLRADLIPIIDLINEKATDSDWGSSSSIQQKRNSPTGQFEMASQSIRLFISHCAEDAGLAERLIDLIRAAIGLSASEIRCTSVDGYRLPGGVDADDQLRREVHESDVFVGIISLSSLRSMYVLFELGARWGAGRHLVPLLAPGIEPTVLDGPLAGLNALRTDNPAQLHQLVEELATKLGRPLASGASFEKYVTALMTTPSSLKRPLSDLSFSGKANREARAMVTVQVFWESTGKPVKGSRVSIEIDGFSGGVTNYEFTDDNGEVHFNVDPGQGKVYVDGSTKFKGRISGRILVYI